jgi:hypothetical protein
MLKEGTVGLPDLSITSATGKNRTDVQPMAGWRVFREMDPEAGTGIDDAFLKR